MSVMTLSIERRDEMETVSRLRIALATFNRASPLKPVCKSCWPPTTNCQVLIANGYFQAKIPSRFVHVAGDLLAQRFHRRKLYLRP
jgi:hypothetical protein